MTFSITVLGSSASIPAYGRFPSAQVVNHNEVLFLIDCGEGTQIRLSQLGIRRGRLNHVFISHLHGDHFFGLIGMLTTQSLLGRDRPMHLYSHSDILRVIQQQLEVTGGKLNFELQLHPLDGLRNEVIFENDVLQVETIPVQHRVPCWGFLFKEKQLLRRYLPEEGMKYGVGIKQIARLKAGEDFITNSGEVIPNAQLTDDPPIPRAYAYVTDTIYDEALVPYLKGVDLLYHETTFDKSGEKRAEETFHSTTTQAATIAKKAQVKQLLMGHYSAKFKDIEPLKEEAREIFPESYLAIDGRGYEVSSG